MKCPNCKRSELTPAKKPGYYSCSRCGFLYIEKANADPGLSSYKYVIDKFRCKDVEVPTVFQKAKNKFDNGKYEVIGLRLERGDYSLLFGQRYTVLKRHLK